MWTSLSRESGQETRRGQGRDAGPSKFQERLEFGAPRLATAGVARSTLLLAFCLWVGAVGCSKSSSASGESNDDILGIGANAESCMRCHNGSTNDDYAGVGLENPHPFSGAATLKCTTCHGGNPAASIAPLAHVPPPPEIGDEAHQIANREAYFNRLTLTGIDRYGPYEVDGVTYTALDYLQFVNPGDIRVVSDGRSCGACHMAHVECVEKSPLATATGIFSGATYAIGEDNQIPAQQGLYQDTAADIGFRSVVDPSYFFDPANTGAVGELAQFPVYSVRGQTGATDIFQNPLYDNPGLAADRNADNSVIPGSPLSNLYQEQVAFTCGDCHLGSAGANNRYGDYRSSGCTSCHMRYSVSGRSFSTDTNITKNEPFDVDDIDPPERAHVDRHRIRSVAQTIAGETVNGIDDYTCAGCHQGSNRTVMQYWGIRLDQNQDVRRGVQYPSNPDSYRNTSNDTRLFDPVINNNTFNGRNRNQYLLEEDYDGDGRDDTPPDVHYEAGLGCIDCHGSHDLHGGVVGDAAASPMVSRQEQAVAIACESCHGSIEGYASTAMGLTYSGTQAELATDREGNVLRHVYKEGDHFYLRSRLTGNLHYVPQTRDVIVNDGKTNPLTGEVLYSERASYAMGRADGDSDTGMGPQQTGGVTAGFSHSDNVSCVACHASWTNNCIGCHLVGEYNNGNNFSNITGQRIVFNEEEAQFVYQSPVPFQLGVNARNEIAPMAPNTEMFFQWIDRNGVASEIFSFSDRNGSGSNAGATAFPSMNHNAMMPHSIRGRVTAENEGPRYCVACHLTTQGLANFGTEYDSFRTAMAANDFSSLDFNLLAQHIGENPGNQLNSPIWVHMVSGLGSGLFLFDEDGCAVNPLDNDNNRYGCNGVAPANNFDPTRVFFNLDKIVQADGTATGSNNHPMLVPPVPNLRDGAANPSMSGPLGSTLIERLAHPTTGIILDSWLDANAVLGGNASTYLSP